jgi:hypothetical protein
MSEYNASGNSSATAAANGDIDPAANASITGRACRTSLATASHAFGPSFLDLNDIL